MAQQTKWSQFGVLTIVFFFWGFVAASNSIFIPFCKEYFNLDQIQSQLIGSAFYGAYFYGSLILYLLSSISGTDLLNKIGYKKGIIIGLLISVVGAISLAFVSAMENTTFPLILVAFFIIALGFSLQQTAAQPFAIALGSPETGAHRLNMAGSLNSFGALVGPLAVSYLLFGDAKGDHVADISKIQQLYFFLSGLFIIAALVFGFTKLPKTTSNEKLEKSPKALISLLIVGALILPILFADAIHIALQINKGLIIISSLALILGVLFNALLSAKKNPGGWGAMSYPQLTLGMIAIFVYVGVEVTIDNNFGALLKLQQFGGYTEQEISHLVSLYWGSMMIGRWTGAVSVFNLSQKVKKILKVVVPFLAFGVILLVNIIKGNTVGEFMIYPFYIAVAVAAFLYSGDKPVKQLITVASFAAFFIVLALFTTGSIANFAIISTGLYCSVMWPSIFALALNGIGKYTSQGSAFLVMMILGGAIIPPTQAAVIDLDINNTGGISFTHMSYIVPLACFAYLIWHTVKTRQVLISQGLDVDKAVESKGH